MSTSKNKQAVVVGIFILIGIVIFIAGVLTLGGQRKTFVKTIPVKAYFKDVSGLQPGNNIWVSGVKVGTVKSVKLAGNAAVEVIMNIEHNAQEFVRKDARAKIGSDGLIGNRIVVIYGGSPAVSPVSAGDVLKVDKPLSTDEMLATLQENNQNLLDITSNFKAISKKIVEGEGTVGQLISDKSLINHLQAAVLTLEKASKNAQNVTSNLSVYTSKLQEKGSLANDLVTDTLVFARLREAVVQIQAVAESAGNITDDLKTASESLHSSKSPVGLLLNDQEAATNLKATLQNLQSSTQKLDENMEALQHNFLFRGYFRKRAKAE
jgi:phospholipid/cholesterol/gamma-HCH transport system substrate-binding protein